MLAKRPALAKSEIEVAQIVWKLGQATVREVFEAMPKERGLDIKTVQTYLRRLEAKGYVQVRRERRSNVYSSRVRASQVVRHLVDDFVNRIFGGQPFPLVQQLLEQQGLTDEEIDRLQDLLNERRKPP
jgi:BlaI family transcriptional regulator, penicillinase repressor